MKNSKYLTALVALLTALVALTPSLVFAKDVLPLSLCEYYEQPSHTLVSVSSNLTEVYAGATVEFTVHLTNAAREPLTDGIAYVKVVGFDEFPRVVAIIEVPLSLPVAPGAALALPVEWKSSPWLSAGTYAAEVVVFAQGRARMASSLDATITGSPYYFSVVRDGDETIGFYSDTISVNGTESKSMGGVYAVPETGSFTIDVPVTNDTMVPVKSHLIWRVYSDATRTELIYEGEAPLKLHAKGLGYVPLTITDTKSPEYLIEGSGIAGDAPFFVALSLKREGYQEPRLLSAGIGRSIIDGARAAYVCVLSANAPADQVRLELKAKRQWQGIAWSFASKTYEGPLREGVSHALTEPVAEGVSGYVTARLYRGDELVDELTVPYGADQNDRSYVPILVGALVVLALLAWWYVRRHP